MQTASEYFTTLNAAVGQWWNRFWFTPSRATTLGVLRSAVGLLALYAVATYGFDLDRWFGPGGMLPLGMVRQLYEYQWSALDYVPTHLLWPAYWVSVAVIALFTLGIGGRAVAILSTIATLSFFSRAPLVTGEFESVLAFLMVYLCIGRAGDEFSVPAVLRSRRRARLVPPPAGPAVAAATSSLQLALQSPWRPPASPTNTIAIRLLQIHIAAVHLMMGLGQLAAPEGAWWSGEGIWLAAMRPGMSLVDLSWLSDHPRIVAAWSHLITLYLLAFPVIAWSRLWRPLVLTVGAVVWLSIAAASGWLTFCAAMLAGIGAFVELQPKPQL
jgi:hypothetical protein